MNIEISWILLFLRAVLAVVMIYYGWPKIRDLEANANDFVKMGFKPGMLWGTLIALVEFFGGIAILAGFYSEFAAALFAFQMMVGTLWKLKISKPFTDYSYDIQLLALSLVVMSQGAGAYAFKAFPGFIFLRWDVALVSLAAALLFAVFSRPDFNSSAQAAADGTAAKVRSGYQRNIRMISVLQSRVAALKEEAVEELREDLKVITQRLNQLAERAARELKEVKNELDFTLLEAEVGLRLTVDDAKAHLEVIEATRELVLARRAISRNDLIEAETRVESALRNLEEAQSLAVGHHESIAVLQHQAQQMLVTVRTKAGTMKASIDALIERSNRLLTEMGGQGAAVKTAA